MTWDTKAALDALAANGPTCVRCGSTFSATVALCHGCQRAVWVNDDEEPKGGVAAIKGKWPGDEDDGQVERAVRDLDGRADHALSEANATIAELRAVVGGRPDVWAGLLSELRAIPPYRSIGCTSPSREHDFVMIAGFANNHWKKKVEEVVVRYDACAAAIAQQADELARLRAVVDKLPKTADGVPKSIGMNLYARRLASEWVSAGFVSMDEPESTDGEWWGTVRDGDGAEWNCRVADCYHDLAAARRAAEGEGGEG